jgi:hypothetical protein
MRADWALDSVKFTHRRTGGANSSVSRSGAGVAYFDHIHKKDPDVSNRNSASHFPTELVFIYPTPNHSRSTAHSVYTMANKFHPQHQSSLLTLLPREILDKIYLELWRDCGLRQHILFHGKGPRGKDKHFCRWACCTEYQVDDPLQADVEKLRVKLGVPLGANIQGNQPPEVGIYCRRLMSPWMNHWPCGERATQEHGVEAISGYTTSDRCWISWRDNRPNDLHVPNWSPYLPMLLTCKRM